MRYIVYGAGAIGGLAGGRMAESGADVVLIARGAHAAAIAADGLTVVSGEGTRRIDVPVVTDPAGTRIEPGDVVLMGVKSHQTAAALDALQPVAPPQTVIACLQNGVDNERASLRLFPRVYGVCVMCPATHLEPGVVQQDSVPVPGLLDIGRFPGTTAPVPDGPATTADPTRSTIAEAFRAAGFDSVERDDIMRWKYRKLLMNVGNAAQALLAGEDGIAVADAAAAEAETCLQAAGIDCASEDEDRARRARIMRIVDIPGHPRGGGSSWQSLRRGTGSIESDYLNGEISLLGRLHGVATPINDLLRHLATEAARRGDPPGTMTGAEFEARLTPAE
ncbi:MAG TPA: 2-dehydropantoate 2-reductase [Acidimicrobiales bacterium]|nr:2-dehydropantoate 2-reductase [Acidimicrobiales bacterium]